ncbi:putative peptidase [Pelagibacter phage Mosig EXVC030M]|nr:putative peptidase [Pelagibacter phage Mosig EXVC030M]
MMKKDTNTMTINLDVKSNLAKLLATENITIQHNNVKTASFDVKNRVLTLPIFKQKSGDVYDMLIAHECAHALWTPYEEWQGINDDELRSYVNVLEDTRIDKLIQAKYPGVVRNYENGFDILEKQNFFGINGRDINKDFMIIDKINLRSKSLNRLPFIFAPKDKEWLAKVDSLVTFEDVLTLAKQMLDWQKEQVEQMQKLPDFDNLEISKAYGINNDDDDFDDEEESDNGQGSGADNSDDEADEKNDFNNFGDQKADDEKDSEQSGKAESKSDNATKDEKEESKGEADSYAKGAGGDFKEPKKLKAITDDSFQQNTDKLLDEKNKGYRYGKIPTPNFKQGSALTSYKKWLKDMSDYRIKQSQYCNIKKYDDWLDKDYKSFMSENKKTVMYLVKEFEMKKSAQAYKRAQTDKTGIIDPLKLPSYKYSDDIFKKLTILPDGKNHGMMMLLDWSGSMSDVLFDTVKQLINLVEFCKKVNIPFEVYFFTSERRGWYNEDKKEITNQWSKNSGEFKFEDFHLVNCLSHRMNKKTIDFAMKMMYHMGAYWNNRYSRKFINSDDYYAQSETWGIPSEYYLGNTPLNESLVYINKLIPMFKSKYDIEKMTFITLTDGAGNYPRMDIIDGDKSNHWEKTTVFELDGKKFTSDGNITANLLNHIKNTHDVNVIGFYVVKRLRRWDIEKYIGQYKDWNDKEQKIAKFRKELNANKAAACEYDGYNKYFVLDGKKLGVENFDLQNVEVKKGTTSELKRIFGKSMANRLVSRVVLNKFIQEVA